MGNNQLCCRVPQMAKVMGYICTLNYIQVHGHWLEHAVHLRLVAQLPRYSCEKYYPQAIPLKWLCNACNYNTWKPSIKTGPHRPFLRIHPICLMNHWARIQSGFHLLAVLLRELIVYGATFVVMLGYNLVTTLLQASSQSINWRREAGRHVVWFIL